MEEVGHRRVARTADQHDPVDAMGGKGANLGEFARRVITCAGDQEAVAGLDDAALHRFRPAGEAQIFERRNDRADRPRLPRRQGARRTVRDIAEFAGRRLYLPLQRFADRTRAREGAGDGGARDAHGLGDVGDAHLLRALAIAPGSFDFPSGYAPFYEPSVIASAARVA